MGPTACLDAEMKTLSLAMLGIKLRSSVFTVIRGGAAGRSLVRLLRGSFRPHYGLGFVSDGYFPEKNRVRCIGLTNLPRSCADCLEIWEPQNIGIQRICPDLLTSVFTLIAG